MNARDLKGIIVFAAIFLALQVAYDLYQGNPLAAAFSTRSLIATGVATGVYALLKMKSAGRDTEGK